MFVRTRKWKWVRRGLITFGILFAIYSLIGFFLVPYLIQKKVPATISEQTGTRTELNEVNFNPYTLFLSTNGFLIADDEDETLFALPALRVNASWKSLFTFSPVLDLIELENPQVNLTRSENNSLNFDGIIHKIASTPSEPTNDEPAALTINRLKIINGLITYEDHAIEGEFSTQITPINLDIAEFSTTENLSNEITFIASSAKGGKLAVKGTFSLSPLSAKGNLVLQSEKLADYSAYARPFTPLMIESAYLTLTTDFDFSPENNPHILSISNGGFAFGEVTFKDGEKETEPLTFESFRMEGVSFSLREGKMEVKHIGLENGKLLAVREQADRLNFARFFKQPESTLSTEETPAPQEEAQAAFLLEITDILTKNVELTWRDETLADSPEWKFDLKNLNVENFTLAGETPIIIGLNGSVAEGTLGAIGEMTLSPLRIDLDISTNNLPLHSSSPYIAPFYHILPQSALLDLTASYHSEGETQTLSGDLKVHNISALNRHDNSTPLKANDIQIKGFKVNITNNSTEAHVDSLELNAPQIVLIVDKEGKLNFNPSHDGQDTDGEDSTSATSFTYSTARITDGTLKFIDQRQSPAVEMELKNIRTEFKYAPEYTTFQILSHNDTGEKIDLKGRVNLDDPTRFLRLDVVVDNINLRPFSTYTVPYVARPILQGSLSLNLQYEITDKQLKGENNIQLKRFYLGDRQADVDPEIKAPVGLALDILRNRADVIALGIPVRGEVDDPSFSLRGVIIQGIMQVFGKVATAPFSLIANLVGTQQDLSQIEFSGGKIQLSEQSRERLDLLANALEERPALTLEMTPVIDPDQDVNGLKRLLLEGTLRELAQTPEQPREELLQQLYEQKILAHSPSAKAEEVPVAVEEEVIPPTPPISSARSIIIRRPNRSAASARSIGQVNDPEGSEPQVPSVIVAEAQEAEEDIPPPNVPLEKPSITEMENALIQATLLPDSALEILASERVRIVKEYLTQNAGVSEDRLRVISAYEEGSPVIELGLGH